MELEQDSTLRDAIPGNKCHICKTNLFPIQIEQKLYTKYKGSQPIRLESPPDQEDVLFYFWSVCYICDGCPEPTE